MRGEINLNNISKKFIIKHSKSDSIKSVFMGLFFRSLREVRSDFWALKNVFLSIKKGESVGIIGRNGAGKSTILYLIAGTLRPTAGDVFVEGRIAPMIELGLGFHPELTGRENVFLNASLYGLSRKEIISKYNEIIDFSELYDFIDSKLTSYSTGMQARLAFSIAANLNPDIFLVDEALSVGDKKFQDKCIKKMLEFRNEGKTILFVSHNFELIKLVCERAVLFNEGEVVFDGGIEKANSEYSRILNG